MASGKNHHAERDDYGKVAITLRVMEGSAKPLASRESPMAKVLVLYDSASGNTAKMAALVVEGAASIAGVEVRMRKVDEAKPDDVLWCDGVALGSPTNMGLLSWKMKRFWDETMGPHWMKVDGKIACAFSSSGGFAGGAEMACQSLLTVLMNFGFLVFGLTDYANKLTTAHYGAVAVRDPRDEGTQAACRLLGKRLAEWVAVYCDGRKEQHPLHKSDIRLAPG
jgi:NAD(P)H dehydrogenase (quinone)